MLRSPSAGDTGNFILSQGQFGNTSLDGISTAQLKLFATTRAYEAAADVGIASPDVLHIETFTTYLGPAIAGAAVPPGSSTYMYADHMVYPTQNLHPSGFPVVTDLLIGVAASNWVSGLPRAACCSSRNALSYSRLGPQSPCTKGAAQEGASNASGSTDVAGVDEN